MLPPFAETLSPKAEIVVRVRRCRGAFLAHRDRRSMRAARERQQNHCASEVEPDAAFHTRENAASFFNEALR